MIPSADELQTVFDAGRACLTESERVLNFNDPKRRTALKDRLGTLSAALSPVRQALPDANLTTATTWHALILKQARKVLQAAELDAEAGKKIISLRWDGFFPLRPDELATELEREILTAQAALGDAEQEASPGWQDLILNNDNRQVRRQGCEHVAEFGGREIPWEIFMRLYREQGNVVSKAALKYSCCAWAEDSTLQGHISAVRKVVKSLGIGVKNKRNVGYWLTTNP